MAARDKEVKELWGVTFDLVPRGLSEEQVSSFVTELMDKAAEERAVHEKQASLLRLAEQTVVEADRLAENIKERAREEGQAEAAKIRAEATAKARDDARAVADAAEKEAKAHASSTHTKAQDEGQNLIRKAEARRLLDDARGRVASTEAEAKLEAEFIVRRMTQKVSEGIRRAVNETCDDLLPTLDEPAEELGTDSASDESKEKPSPRPKGGASRRR